MTSGKSIAFTAGDHSRFHGAKVTVLVSRDLVTLLRDARADIPYPNHWDLPGGGREGDESPWGCAARECFEETHLRLTRRDVIWARSYVNGAHTNWFFVARISEARAGAMHLGSEGQALMRMSIDHYLTHPKAIPNFQRRLADWIAGMAGADI
ncbi:NUDIX hydrolase [Cognatishimia sp. SS12]|uniref:NUDIX hydrolase n=1 Tax=Cognatishimia sp. SS12 TaxID=2979465 RepID=UPI00232D23E0|nr:NUDIX hydrolase [Cognatishimia sp. SS12]MDC0738034.1 NUDIX hydrolase [Cognatishimia sp. SS12]